MAGSVNKVILIGNLGTDPELRSFSDGNRVCNLRVATSETWKDRTIGERLCCTIHFGDSLYESSVIAGRHEQLGPYEVQDQELAFVQHSAEATRIAVDLV